MHAIALNLVQTKITGHRKGLPDVPAYQHSIRVSEAISTWSGADDETILAALLHDVVDDGGVSFEELRSMGFSENVIHLVDLCSHDVKIADKDARWVNMVARLALAGDARAWAIKLADVRDNLGESESLDESRRNFMLNVKAPLLLKLSEKLLGDQKPWLDLQATVEKMKK